MVFLHEISPNDFFTPHQILVSGIVVVIILALVSFRPHKLNPRVPVPVEEYTPLLGAASFWNERWTFFQRAISSSATGNFSFWAGPYHVIGLSGDSARRTFYNTKSFGIAEGYAVLGGNLPSARVNGDQGEDIWPKGEFLDYLKERVRRMMRKDVLEKRLPALLNDTISAMNSLQDVFDPFEDIYRLIFQLMMRGIGCDDVACDRKVLDSMLENYNAFSASATREAIIFPRLPTWSLVKRYFYGARLFLKLQSIVQDRQKLAAENIRKHDDPLQGLVDGKCGTSHTIGIILGAVFAGQQNTSVNAAWILVHLAHDQLWTSRVRSEIESVVKRYAPDTSNLIFGLSKLPIDAWEREFPTIDLCVKENLRLHGLGSQIRRNTGSEVKLESGEVIPAQAFVSYHTADIHLDPLVYPDPMQWDPARYVSDRAEDTRKPLAWAGWGAGRHVCLGMRLAQLQLHIIVAVFVATFEEIELSDEQGSVKTQLPEMDLEAWVSDKPVGGKAWLKLRRADSP